MASGRQAARCSDGVAGCDGFVRFRCPSTVPNPTPTKSLRTRRQLPDPVQVVKLLDRLLADIVANGRQRSHPPADRDLWLNGGRTVDRHPDKGVARPMPHGRKASLQTAQAAGTFTLYGVRRPNCQLTRLNRLIWQDRCVDRSPCRIEPVDLLKYGDGREI